MKTKLVLLLAGALCLFGQTSQLVIVRPFPHYPRTGDALTAKTKAGLSDSANVKSVVCLMPDHRRSDIRGCLIGLRRSGTGTQRAL